jgi:hypothetical protein
MELCFNSKHHNKIKIGLLFVNPQKKQFVEIKDILISETNKSNSKKRLAILVPYRDREVHLKQFIPYMNKFLKHFNYQIIVIHQRNIKLFNRGALFNIGFHIIKDYFDYFCFHDVDLLPEGSDYSYPENPSHLSMYCSQFNYRKKNIFGGVTLMTKEQFLKINGFSNNYRGWGGEDDDLRVRVNRFYTPNYRPGKYTSLPHKHIGQNNPNYDKNKELFLERKEDPTLSNKDGISKLLNGSFKFKTIAYHRINDDGKLVRTRNITYRNKLNFIIDVDF